MFLFVGLFVFASGIEFPGKETASSLGTEGFPYKLDWGPLGSLSSITVSSGPGRVTCLRKTVNADLCF